MTSVPEPFLLRKAAAAVAAQVVERHRHKEKEIETVTLMVRRYCCGVHGTRGGALCPACNAMLEYARERRDRCLHGKI